MLTDDLAEKASETAWTDYLERNHEKRNCSVNVNRDMDIILSTGRYRLKGSLNTGNGRYLECYSA
ncbi:hypothetical protein Q0F98_10310 [Paenibacillus amylolyticus]|nr:hypothetical protein Q0F98_10310 [Paenibacillus amylolyticus]